MIRKKVGTSFFQACTGLLFSTVMLCGCPELAGFNVNPATLDFAADKTELTFTVGFGEVGDLAGVTWTVSSGAAWLTFQVAGLERSATLNGTGAGEVTVFCDRGRLLANINNATITVTAAVPGVGDGAKTIAVTADGGKGVEGTDTDGDGFPDEEEKETGTDPGETDSDDDGMPDGWENDNGLNPVSASDATGDPDGDEYTNLEEYLERSNPQDANSPIRTLFVSPTGDNSTDGSRAAPWKTVEYALVQAEVSTPVRILLLKGTYVEAKTLFISNGITLMGAKDGGVLEGFIEASSGVKLKNFVLQEPEDAPALDLTGEGQAALDALLTSHDATITVERVTFRGAMESKRMGIHLSGAPDKQPLVDQCVFGSLAVGMQIDGALPLVRRCFFDHLTVTGIRFEEGAGSKADAATSFSDETDANTGYNTFNGYDNEKKAVINNRSSEITMPNNDWGTDDAAAISNMTQGVGAVPALAAGSGLIPASMYCSVWNAKTKSYLSNASVAVTPGSLKALSSSQNGIYPFVCLPAGSYTVEVTAEGFRSGRVNVSLGGGQQKVLNIPVSDLTALGCSGKDEPSQVRASITSGMGNIGLYMMVGLLLTVAALRRRDVSR